MPKEHGVPNGASLDTLTPARAELAQAISAVTTAVDLVERAQQPQDQLAIIMARAKIGEAEALEAELARLREQRHPMSEIGNDESGPRHFRGECRGYRAGVY